MLPHNLPPEYLLRQPTRIDDWLRPAREVPLDRFALATGPILRAVPAPVSGNRGAPRTLRWRLALGHLLIRLGERLAGASRGHRLPRAIGTD